MALFGKKKKVIDVGGKKIELEPKPSGFSLFKKKPVQIKRVGQQPEQQPEQQQAIPKISLDQVKSAPQPSSVYAPPKPKQQQAKPQAPLPKNPDPLKSYIMKQAQKHKGLENALMEQGIKSSLYDFARRMFFASIMLTLIITVALFILLLTLLPYKQSEAVIFAALIGFTVYNVSFNAFLNYPQSKAKQSTKNIERDILFAARDMIISLRSGMPLYNTITSISTGYGDASKEFAKIVERVQLGTPLEDAIDQTVADTKSPSFRRIMLQAAVSIRAGADVVGALQSVIDQLSEERVIDLRRYGQRLNAIAMFYMLFGIILPSMGIAVVTILTTFIALFTVTPVVLDFALVGIMFLQIVFLQMIRGSRPVFTM